MCNSQTSSAFSWHACFRRRSGWVLVGVGCWLLLIVLQLLRFMVFERDTYLERYVAQSARVGSLPALRGRILSANGVPLAWSVRHLVLQYRVSRDEEIRWRDCQLLHGRLDLPDNVLWGRVTNRGGDTVVLKADLGPEELVRLQPVVRRHPRLSIEHRFERRCRSDTPGLRERLGRTRTVEHVEVGISGWEREFDQRLRGRDGVYRVMVDKTGTWIPETWQQVQAPVPGFDVYAPLTVTEGSSQPGEATP